MTRPFVKMNGAGNDFVVVNALETPFAPTADQARAIADRKTGEGCDQLIALEPSTNADAFMRVWNADGGVVETCGNALRCIGWMLLQSTGKAEVTIDTLGGPTTARRAADGRITVDMGVPRLDWEQIPLDEAMDTRGIELQVGPIDAPVLHTPGAVSMACAKRASRTVKYCVPWSKLPKGVLRVLMRPPTPRLFSKTVTW